MILFQNVGIDGALKNFKACFMVLDENQSTKIKGSRSFSNTQKGFQAFADWLTKKRLKDIPLRITMEATGVYYERLAYFLHHKDYYVSVLLPNKARAYFKTLNLKSKTDDLEAKALAQLGLERKFDRWIPMSDQMYKLKRFCRERVMLIEEKTVISNRLHAEQNCQNPSASVIKRMKSRIKLLAKQIKQVEKQIQQTTQKDQELAKRIEKICHLKGLGFLTVISVVAETDGFKLFRNRSQLTSFAGYDVVQKQSGTSVNGKTRISKKGNKYIRRALHLPSLSIIRYDENFRNLYQRVFERTKIKMKGIVAVQRKVLLVIFTLYNKNQAYDPSYLSTLNSKSCRQETLPAYSG